MNRGGKLLFLLCELGITSAVWWSMQPDDERTMLCANAWKAVEVAAMRVAKLAANIAATAEHQYKAMVMR